MVPDSRVLPSDRDPGIRPLAVLTGLIAALMIRAILRRAA